MSTPPASPATASSPDPKLSHGPPSSSLLTPPTSPRQNRSSSNISDLATPISASYVQSPGPLLELKHAKSDAIATEPPNQSIAHNVDAECPFGIEILKDERAEDAIFGVGAWSTVFKATTHVKPRTVLGSLTPPLSPTIIAPVLVAVKKPARRDALTILKNEAKILSHLRAVADHEKYVVPFYGVLDEATIVMAAIPFSLEKHVRKCTVVASQNFSTWTMTEPVLGSTAKWVVLARQLISALSWLHGRAQVIHGDIKPGNILLSRVQGSATDITFQPVLADFSSSQRLDIEETTPNTLSAVTREYTAPELLTSKVLRDPISTATTASDVFSMAITLLVSATGQMLVYHGSMFQRQAMATQGWMVLSNARNGEGGTRVPRFGVVEKVLERAVSKADMGRMSAQQWLGMIENLARGEPAKI